jgi:alpha-L-rhamnosidase
MKPRIFFGILIVLLLLISNGCTPLNQTLMSSNAGWTAKWISPVTATTNLWMCYRKGFFVDRIPNHAITRIAADSKYWLWINGELVVREGGLKRGPTPTGTYYDELDVASHLRKGSNTVAVLAWYFGKDGFSHNSSGQPGLVFEASCDGLKIISDTSWKMKQSPAFSMADGIQPNRRLPESSIRFDARQSLSGWTECDYDDSSWETPKVTGIPPIKPWGSLECRPIPFWKDYGLKDYSDIRVLTNTPDGSTVIGAEIPHDAQVTPWLKVDAAPGLTIDMRTDDFLGGGEPNIHAEYVTCVGIQEFEAFGWMNGHEMRYTIPAGVKVLALKYRETGFNTEFTGRFECDDPFVNTLWNKARRTLYVTMRDNYMDCPDRERAQWWGDAVNELGEVFYAFDPNAATLTRKAMLELARWQRSDGTLYAPVPSGRPADDFVRKDHGDGTWNSELPPQMLASVGKYGFWTYYLYTGDRQAIATVYPHVRAYLKIWQFDADGLVIHRKGDWDWEDWGTNIDAHILDSAWYHLALEAAVNMARVCGQEQDIPEWQARMKAIESEFNHRFWTGTEYRSPDYTGDTDDRANALAVVAGLAKPEQYTALRKVLAEHYNASPYMEKYVLESLYLMGVPEQALERVKHRYRTQVASELTTLWEGWGIGTDGFGGGTYNHAWSGGPLTLLSQYAAGVTPVEPGYGIYQIRPQMGPLKRIQTTVSTVKGTIDLSLTQTNNSFRMNLNSPEGTHVRIAIPQTTSHMISKLIINRKITDFRNQRMPKGVKFLKEDKNYVWLEAASGLWSIDARY